MPEVFENRGAPAKYTVCPHCGAIKDRHASVAERAVPRDEDVSMCITCGDWAIYDAAALGGLRKPTTSEQAEIDNHPLAQHVRQEWEEMMRQLGRSQGD